MPHTINSLTTVQSLMKFTTVDNEKGERKEEQLSAL